MHENHSSPCSCGYADSKGYSALSKIKPEIGLKTGILMLGRKWPIILCENLRSANLKALALETSSPCCSHPFRGSWAKNPPY